MDHNKAKVKRELKRIFSEDKVDQISKETGLVKRKRKISALPFISPLIFWTSDRISYEDIAAFTSSQMNISVSKQAIGDKVKKAEKFMQTAAKVAMKSLVGGPINFIVPDIEQILIADSTTQTLSEGLASLYIRDQAGKEPQRR
jgi:hypothetical protein